MVLDADLERELTPLRKAVDGLRQSLSSDTPAQPTSSSDPDFLPLRPALDAALAAFHHLGFVHLGDVTHRREGRPPAFARWIRDTLGTTTGWTGVVTTKRGQKTVAVLCSEVMDRGFRTTGHGTSRLGLAPTPGAPYQVFDLTDPLASVVTAHHVAAADLSTTGPLTVAMALADALAVQERHRSFRLAARARMPPDALLRADLLAVLTTQAATMNPDDFALIYSRAAAWLGLALPPARH